MRRTTAASLTVSAVTMALLAGCSDDSSESPVASGSTSGSSSPSSSASPSASPTDSAPDASAARAVTRAVSGLRKGNSGAYRLQALIGSTGVVEQGTYRLRPVSYDLVRTIQPLTDGQPTPGQGVTVRLKATGGKTWLRLVRAGGQGSWPCWVRANDTLAPLTGVDGGAPTPPPAVAAMLGARGTSVDGADVLGSTDLSAGVAVLGSQAVGGFGLEADTDARLPARFAIEQGEVKGWSEDVGDVPSAMTAAGLTVPAAVTSLDGQTLPVRVAFAQPKGGVTVTAPAPEKVVEVTGTSNKALTTAMRGCARR